MDSVLNFGVLALVGSIWFVTMIAYGACIAAARADRATRQAAQQHLYRSTVMRAGLIAKIARTK